MIGIETKLTGDMAGSLDKFAKNVREQVIFAGVAAMAKVIYNEVIINAEKNKKSGLLQSAIYRVYSPEKSGADFKLYRISWNKSRAPHGHLLEYGTSRAPAYPFMRPAFDHIGAAISSGKAAMANKISEI